MSSQSLQSSSAIKTKQRIFGAAENALVNTSQQHQGYMKVGEVLHLQGPHISLDTLISVIRRLQLRHPFLRSRLQINPTKPNSYLMEEDDAVCLKTLEISRERANHRNFWLQKWVEREKEIMSIGQGLIEIWLLQDPDDRDNDDSPREIVLICDHSICDGLSLSTVAHELLIDLSDDGINTLTNSLNWPITMEAAVYGSLSFWSRLVTFSKFVFKVLYWHGTHRRPTARVPFANIDFPLSDMAKYCHTEAFYGTLNKEETQKLLEKCRRENVTLTSAVSSAILCIASTLVSIENNQSTQLIMAIVADTRRRCEPPVPNHDLSYQVSGVMAFTLPTADTPTTLEGMWQLAKAFGHHVKSSVDAGNTLALAMIMGKLYQKNIGPIDVEQLPTCVISNWGLLPFREQYGRWILTTMTPFGNMVRAAMPVFLVQTVNGILTIGCLGPSPLISPNILENLCNGTISNLRKMIED